ncbi:Flp pilus assembly protein CpaB, partial [Myxococcota bacterium]|nr:Flp pilus assembly protein CpaB [Myxococcota bacterium]
VAYLAVKEKGDEISRGWEPVKVLMAKRDLKSGDSLTKENLKAGLIPKALATKSVITLKDVNQGTPVFGRKLAFELNAGDPVTFQHIHTKSGDQHMAEAIQKKGRAISIRVSPEASVHHWIEPGDRVDIIGTFRDPRSRELVAVTLLQNVIVLATGRIGGQTNMRLLSESDKAYNTVTVHVLPEAVEMLVLAQELGSVYLSLRSMDDHEITELGVGKTNLNTLMTGERSRRLSKTQSKIFKVEIIRGSRREMQIVH